MTLPPQTRSASRRGNLPSQAALREMASVCRDAWQQNLLSGCNGNASFRLGHAPHMICLTRSGSAKGRLTPQDCCVVDMADGRLLHGRGPSSEAGMHLAVYRARPDCAAILHTHPRRLLALSLRLHGREENFLRLPLYEAEVWRGRLAFAPALPPGSEELALAVAEAARAKAAVWMAGHGLCATGTSLTAALCLTEELEHLAAVQLLALGGENSWQMPAQP